MKKIKDLISKIKQNGFWKNLLKNFFHACVGEGGAAVLNLVSLILIVRLMGDDNYGLMILAQTYMSIVDSVINIQSWKGIINFGQKALAEDDKERYYGYLKLGTILDVSTAVAGAIICFLLSDLVGLIFGYGAEFITSAKLFSIVIFFHFSGTPTALLRIENKFNWVAIQKICAAILKLSAIVILYFCYGYISILTGTIIFVALDIIGHLILTIMALIFAHKKYGLRNIIKAKKLTDKKKFVSFTIWTTCSDIVDIPINYFDVFIISSLSLTAVTVFKFFKQITSIFSKLTTPLKQASYPSFSALVAKKENKKAYDVMVKLRNVCLIVLLPLALIMGLTSAWWLNIIFNYTYAQYWYVLTIYLVASIVSISYVTLHPLFTSMGHVKKSFLICLIANVIYAGIALLLVNVLNLGMLGIVFSYIVQFSIVIISKTIIIKKELAKEPELLQVSEV